MIRNGLTTILVIGIGIFASSLISIAGEIVPLPVQNASFEDSKDYTQTVRFTNEGGSIATVDIDTKLAATGKQSLHITRTNALGRTTVTWKETFPAKSNQLYEVSVGIHLKEATYGATPTLEVIELDRNGKDVGAHAPGWNFQVPVFNRPQEFLKHKVNFVTGKETTGLQVNYILSGNPLEVNLDDLLVTKGADNAYYLGIHKPGDPAPERSAILKKLENIKPREAWVERRNDKSTLIVDGQPIPLILYYGDAHISSFAKAGVHLYVTNLWKGANLFWDKNNDNNAQIYRGNGRFDFSLLENELFRIVNADPKAMVLVTISVDPDPAWCEAHPDSIFQTSDGGKGVVRVGNLNVDHLVTDLSQKKPEQWWAQSYASQDYQDYVCEGLKALARFLKESPAGKIVIGFTLRGGNDGQFLPWVDGGTLDYSPATQKAFRGWLREKYGDDNSLQKDWGGAYILATLDTATLASPSQISSKSLFSSQPGLDRRVVDSKEFTSIATARMNRRFLGALKKEFGRRIIGHTYYNDIMWPHVTKLSVDELLGGPEVDAITTCSAYAPWRRSGATGMSSDFCVASAVLRNKLHITELDHRTWLSDGAEVDALLSMARDAEDFNAQIRRDVGAALTRGGGVWFYDMGGSWYEDPSLMSTIAESVKMAEWTMKTPRQPKPQMAIFLDERSGFYTGDFSSQYWNYPLGQTAWNACGVPVDIYLLEDITSKNLPDYKFYLILSPITVSKEQAEAIIKRTRQPGKVLMVVGTPAIVSPDFSGSQNIATILGMNIKKGEGTKRQVMFRDETVKNPLIENVSGIIGREDVIYRGWAPMPNMYWYYVADPEATILGRWADGGEPALAVKITPNGTVIFSAVVGGYTPQLLNNAACIAGIKPVSPAGNATYVGYGIAVSHRMTPLPVTLDFGSKVRIFDAEGRQTEITQRWSPSPATESCRTALTFYHYEE